MSYGYIPQVPDYYTPPDYSESDDGEDQYYADLEEKRKREHEDSRED